MKKINAFILIDLVSAILFSVLNICFAADVSCLAFVLSFVFTGILFYFLGIKFYKQKDESKIFIARKLLQYEPYVFLIAFIVRRAGVKGTGFGFDVVSVLLWLTVFVTSICLSRWFDPKKYNSLTEHKITEPKNESLAKMLAKGKTREGKKVCSLDYVKWFFFEVFDWADALVQAVFMVLLFQIFFFQFYKIPTESMVPEFMVNDRVAVSKITSGPKFPLSEVGFPCVKKYQRGDIIVFRNPHYTINRESEVKTVVSQIIYMLTFTLVNTNVDEHGRVKADPLVKRITGVPGEQLMLQDGILYSRTKENPVFTPVQEDAKWAAYNLNTESEAVKKYIKDFKVSDQEYAGLTFVENARNNLDIKNSAEECRKISKDFSRYAAGKSTNPSDDELISLFTEVDLYESALYEYYDSLALKVYAIDNGKEWFNAFMTDWIDNYEGLLKDNLVGGNLYSDANFRLNIMYKLTVGKLCLRIAENMKNGVPAAQWSADSQIVQLHNELGLLHNYMRFFDGRNMPVFPENDENGNPSYIPDDCYFMMGDNRFNSFDMRHTENGRVEKLTPYDNFSVTYYTYVKPMYVPKKLILGSAAARFWPLGRPTRSAK